MKKKDTSSIFLYEIVEKPNISAKIYGPELLQKTRLVLQNTDKAVESDYLQLIKNYFREVRKQARVVTSDEKKALLNLDFAKIGEFQLIEDRKTNSVFVQLNLDSVRLWESYCELFSREDLKSYEKRKLFQAFKADFYDYVINVPIPHDTEGIAFDSPEEMGFYVSKLAEPSGFYQYDPDNLSKNKGYVNPGIYSF